MRTAAILPVKRFAHAKQRLGASVADRLRLDLAAAMVDDVLDALARTDGLALRIVVTSEPSVADSARRSGAIVVRDAPESGQSAAVALGIERALEHGAERVLCVPGDCPALDAPELSQLLAAAGDAGPRVVIVPDRHGTGTNGLLLSPPRAIEPSFGLGSCERHRALAAAAGADCRVARLPTLLLDIDTGADLHELRERLAAHPGGAERTRATLGAAELDPLPSGA
ncbi:MAG TPA: 2-phospho-L-lactate guanylyltransferase [Solirubrobacteraceae bacterium]|nr:2-phospho-L-lactate guanylyltransferase [Solirubrobacteraceae bacterium]